MANILLAALVAVFILAFAAQVLRKQRRDKPSWLSRLMSDIRRGFTEGYRGPSPEAPASAPVT